MTGGTEEKGERGKDVLGRNEARKERTDEGRERRNEGREGREVRWKGKGS